MRTTAPEAKASVSQNSCATPRALESSLAFLQPVIVQDLVRIGNGADGGYVVSKSALDTIDALISFGVGCDWTVEKSIHKIYPNIPIHSYDYAVGAPVFLRLRRRAFTQLFAKPFHIFSTTGPMSQIRQRLAIFRELRTVYPDYRSFFRGNRVHFRERVFNRRERPGYIRIVDVLNRLPNCKSIFLKIDIEGDEYRIIPDVLKFCDRLVMLVIEFHETEPYRAVFVQQIADMAAQFCIIHLHANNYGGVANDGLPECLEITFLRRELVHATARRKSLPLSSLDYPNDPTRPDLALRWE